MFEIKSKIKKLPDGTQIETFTRETLHCNVLEVEAGTNGYHGGDAGHGSRTYFRIKDLCATDWEVRLTKGRYGAVDGFEVLLEGDAELNTIIKALKFITQVLEHQSKGVDD